MDTALIATKGQMVLPVAVRRTLGLKPGMRVPVKVVGKRTTFTPRTCRHAPSLAAVQAVLARKGPPVAIEDMWVTDSGRSAHGQGLGLCRCAAPCTERGL